MTKKRCLRCPNEFKSKDIDRFLCDSCISKLSKMHPDEVKGELVWDEWRRNEITHEELQRELDPIVGVQPKGFFVKLADNLRVLVEGKIPIQYRETFSYEEIASKRDEVRAKIIEKTNWSSFWQFHKDMLTNPTQNELEHLKQMSNHELIDFFKLVCLSLKQLINNNLESSEIAQNLHGYYKLIKKEINSRPRMPQLPQKDAFIEYCQNKQQYKEDLEKMERCRELGICPKCESKDNVISYGDKWKCTSCKRYFRKR